MIPKRATFYWSGPQMSELRQKCIKSFMDLNPEWRVIMLDAESAPIDAAHLSDVHKSDWTRYYDLHKNGGVYFDTDIMFYEPFPVELLDCDLLLASEMDRLPCHIAAIGAVPGESLMRECADRCHDLRNELDLGYQSLGLPMLHGVIHEAIQTRNCGANSTVRNYCKLEKEKFLEMPASLVRPFDSEHINEARYAMKREAIPDGAIGIHWYGGASDMGVA